MKTQVHTANTSAFKGLLFALPFIITNFVVGLRLEPFYSILWLVPVIRETPLLPLLLLLLFPIGAFISIRPILQSGKNGKYLYYKINILVAVILMTIFLLIFYGLSEELYRCQILQIPNCD